MQTKAARELKAARESGQPDFVTSPTRVKSTGLVIPPIHAQVEDVGWRLEDDWTYEGDGYKLTIPRGWETDLATVPRPLRKAINSFGFGITGPLLHDFLYDHAGCPPEGSCEPSRRFSRREADRILRQLTKAERVPAWRRHLAYLATRLAGWSHWGEPNRART